MPTNTLQSRQAPLPLIFNAAGVIVATSGLGVEAFRYVVPDLPASQGMVIRSASFKAQATAGGTVNIAIQNGATTILSTAAVTASTDTATTLTLADDATSLMDPGDVLTVDVTEGTLAATTTISNLSIQIDLDWR